VRGSRQDSTILQLKDKTCMIQGLEEEEGKTLTWYTTTSSRIGTERLAAGGSLCLCLCIPEAKASAASTHAGGTMIRPITSTTISKSAPGDGGLGASD
jgi:hypothetical protein